MPNAFICDAIRTPIGRYGGALAHVRTDDLGAIPLRALIERNPNVDWSAVDDVIYGCANQAGEDNRNVGRMALLLAGLPVDVPGTTVNRLCGSSMDAIAMAARAIKSGETSLMIAGGVESMSRAPFVIGKADSPFGRKPDPAGLTFLAETTGVAPARALLVGDSPVDLATARNAGAQICLARYGFGYRFGVADFRRDEYFIDAPQDLVRLLAVS